MKIFQYSPEPVTMEYIVSEYKSNTIISKKFFTYNKSISQSFHVPPESCAGLEKSPGRASGDGATATWRIARSPANSSYAGFSDWRIPTRVEMASIVDFTRSPGYPTAMTVSFGVLSTISDRYETIMVKIRRVRLTSRFLRLTSKA